jgi:hypothetical protein
VKKLKNYIKNSFRVKRFLPFCELFYWYFRRWLRIILRVYYNITCWINFSVIREYLRDCFFINLSSKSRKSCTKVFLNLWSSQISWMFLISCGLCFKISQKVPSYHSFLRIWW